MNSEQQLRDAFIKVVQCYWNEPDVQELPVWQWLAIRVDRAARIASKAAVDATLMQVLAQSMKITTPDKDTAKQLVQQGIDAFIKALLADQPKEETNVST